MRTAALHCLEFLEVGSNGFILFSRRNIKYYIQDHKGLKIRGLLTSSIIYQSDRMTDFIDGLPGCDGLHIKKSDNRMFRDPDKLTCVNTRERERERERKRERERCNKTIGLHF